MNFLDIILLVPLIWFAYRGFSRGFVIELASLVALVAGIWAAIHFSFFASDFLAANFGVGPKYLSIIAFIVTFVAVVLVVYLIGKIIEKFIDILALGFLNKLAGLAFGVFKAAFLMSIIILIINSFDQNQSVITPKNRNGSLLYKPIEKFAPWIIPRLSIDEIRDIELDSSRVTRHASLVTAVTPGNCFPSIYSSIAPPPVET
jgi:membrane protein required for colicin V production